MTLSSEAEKKGGRMPSKRATADDERIAELHEFCEKFNQASYEELLDTLQWLKKREQACKACECASDKCYSCEYWDNYYCDADFRYSANAYVKTLVSNREYFINLLGTKEDEHLKNLYTYAEEFAITDYGELLYRLVKIAAQKKFCEKRQAQGRQELSSGAYIPGCHDNSKECESCGHPISDLYELNLPLCIKFDPNKSLTTLLAHRLDFEAFFAAVKRNREAEA